MTTDIVSIIEAAYQVEQSETDWLRQILHTASPLLDRGMGCSAFFYDASDVTRLRLHGFIAQRARDDDAIMRAIERSSPDRVKWVFRTQACRTASEGPDWANQPAAKLFRTWGIADVLFINGLDPSGVGCFVTAKLSANQRVHAGAKRSWSRLATHVASGYRLVRRFSRNRSSDLADAAAVLTPGGKVEHADGDATERAARNSLRDAVAVIERARGKMRSRDPDAAVASWRGLVAAKWSLVDHFDRDGKRYFVARENEASTPSSSKLSARERQAVAYARLGHTNKFIAYELGISASTVGVLLWRASVKLGAKTREELFDAFDHSSGSGET